MSVLPLAAQTAGPATTIVAAKTAIKGGLLLKLLLACGGALAGSAGGVAGVLFGSRKLLREARDGRERRDLIRFTVVNVALVLTVGVMFPLSWKVTHSPAAPLVNFALFTVALVVLHHVWLPRIVSRRHETEMRENPARAARRRRAERRANVIGWTLGLTFGTIGLLLGLYLSHGR
jgi:hypothetical protein